MALIDMETIWWGLIIAVLTFFVKLLIRRRQFVALANKMPGPSKFSLLNYVWQLNFGKKHSSNLETSLIRPFAKAAPLVGVWMGPFPVVYLTKVEAAKILLTNNQQIDKAYGYHFVAETLGDSILTSTGPKWHSRRKLMNPSFGFRMMDTFYRVTNEQTDILIQLLHKHCQENGDSELDAKPYMSKCFLDIISAFALGYELKSQIESFSEFANAIKWLCKAAAWRITRLQYHLNFTYNLTEMKKKQDKALQIINEFTSKIITKKQKEMCEKNGEVNKSLQDEEVLGQKRKLCLIDLLIENLKADNDKSSPGLTEREIQDEINTVFLAGHDTTSGSATWFLYCIGHHIEIQRKVQEEIDQYFADEDILEIKPEHIQKMKYLESVIKETLRLFPTAPAFGRMLNSDLEICGYKIPTGTNVFVSVYFIHRDEQQFKNPHIFDPDRFLPENSIDRDQHAYLPFSSGLRNCIGNKIAMMELMMLGIKVLKNFNVKIDGNFESEPEIEIELLLRPVKPIMIKLTPRKF